MKQKQKRWVPVTGIGALSTLGLDFPSTYEALFKERQLPTLPRRFELGHQTSYPVFELPPSKLDFSNQQEPWLRTSRMAVTAATEALTDAGWNDLSKLKHLKVGVCIGTTVGGSMNDEKFYRDFRDHKTPDMQPITRYLNSNPAEVIAKVFALCGPKLTVVNACSSGTDAISIGAEWIKSVLCAHPFLT